MRREMFIEFNDGANVWNYGIKIGFLFALRVLGGGGGGLELQQTDTVDVKNGYYSYEWA